MVEGIRGDASWHQLSQYTGGLVDPHRLSLNPFAMDQHPHQSVYDFKAALNATELAHGRANDAARYKGFKSAPVPPDLARMRHADATIRKLESDYHRPATSEEQKAKIRSLQIEMARQALSGGR